MVLGPTKNSSRSVPIIAGCSNGLFRWNPWALLSLSHVLKDKGTGMLTGNTAVG